MINFITQFSLVLLVLLCFCTKGYFFLRKLKNNNYIYLTSIFGYSIIVILINFFYFALKLDSKLIFYILGIIFIIIFFYNLFFYKKEFIKNILLNLIIVTPIVLFFIFLSSIYGEQYYVFRGNPWDYFGYITSANFSAENNLNQIQQINNSFVPENQNMYFKRATHWFNFFPAFSSVFGVFLNSLTLNVFLEFYLFKVVSYSLYSLSIFALFKNILNLDFKRIFLITQTFVFSFYSIYIFEIDSLRQLSTLSIFFSFLVVFQNLILKDSFKFKEIFLLSILTSVLYLLYGEILIISGLIILVSLCFNRNYLKVLKIHNFKIIFAGLIIFIIFVLPSIRTMYETLISQLGFGLSLKPIWYVYFGSFFLGRITPDLINQEFILFLSSQLNSGLNIIEFFLVILKSLNEFNYNYVYLNIIPSFFGFYYLTDFNLGFKYIYQFLLILFSLYLIFNYLKNLKNIIFSKEKNLILIKVLIILFFLMFLFFFFQAKIFALIKLILYFSIILFIPIFIEIKKIKIKYFLCLIVFIFPIYKFSIFNHGINRQDSFPSIQILDTKKKYNWIFQKEKFDNCFKVKLYFDDSIILKKYKSNEDVLNYFKYLNLVLNLKNNNYKFIKKNTLINKDNNSKKICEIHEEKIN